MTKTVMLATKYGAVEDNNELGKLDEQKFLEWAKAYRKTGKTVPSTTEDFILLYKHELAKDYADKYFTLLEKTGG